jgi:subtilase-type serine protease
LQIDDLRVTRLESRIGLKVGGAALLRGHWLLQPQLQLDRVGMLGNTNEAMLVRFASAPDFAFALPMPGHRGHWTEIKGGVRISNGPLAFGLGVERSFRRAENAGDRAVLEASLRF